MREVLLLALNNSLSNPSEVDQCGDSSLLCHSPNQFKLKPALQQKDALKNSKQVLLFCVLL
jgi:hypothetical protein